MRSLIVHSVVVVGAAATALLGSALAGSGAGEAGRDHRRPYPHPGLTSGVKPLGAQRNRRASKPNETAWGTLRCSNAVYNVRLIPDTAAHVEKVDDFK